MDLKSGNCLETQNGNNFNDESIDDSASQDISAAETRAIRKLDRWVIPPIMLLYLFSFLDRVNIGNARLYGLEDDLGLTGNQFQFAVSILFVTYILVEVPSNLVLKKFRPSRWLAFITVGWGIAATLTGIVQDFGGLIACRLILGALEGGLFPGLTIYLTYFYTRQEIGLRVGYLFVCAAVAGSLGGFLAYGIGFMDGIAGQRAWRWIMIIEGLPTVILGIASLFWLADDPETAHYLTSEERHLLVVRKRRQVGHSSYGDRLHKEHVVAGLKDWKSWAFCIAQFGVDTMLYGYSVFLPTIIRGIGSWGAAQVQALTIPCYFLGALAYLAAAYLSDRFQRRGLPVIVFAMISVIGYGILLSNVSEGAKYCGCFMIATGLYVCVGIPIAWVLSNNPRYGKRVVANGLQVTIGNCSGIMAPFLYQSKDGPRFIRGHAVTMSLVAGAALLYAFLLVRLGQSNKRRESDGCRERAGKLNGKEPAELGEYDPNYRYTC